MYLSPRDWYVFQPSHFISLIRGDDPHNHGSIINVVYYAHSVFETQLLFVKLHDQLSGWSDRNYFVFSAVLKGFIFCDTTARIPVSQSTFHRKMSRASSASYLPHAGFLLGLRYVPEEGGDMFHWLYCLQSPDRTTLYPKRSVYALPPLWEVQMQVSSVLLGKIKIATWQRCW
jgi:hypothetical protein